MSALVDVSREIRASLLLWLALLVAFFAAFPLLQLALLIVRFQEFPNYLTVHDWPGNIARIVRMTPSIADMVSIMRDEWLIEIGSMNFAYGHGIAEWSFVLVPAKAGVTLVIALLLATNVVLLRAVRKTCPLSARLGASAAAAGGALLAGAATMTITWVVCCAAPTWVVGLTVLGVSVATAFALQPIGGWLSLFGIVLLGAIAAALVRQLSGRRRSASAAMVEPSTTRWKIPRSISRRARSCVCSVLRAAASRHCSTRWPAMFSPPLDGLALTAPRFSVPVPTGAWCSSNIRCSRGRRFGTMLPSGPMQPGPVARARAPLATSCSIWSALRASPIAIRLSFPAECSNGSASRARSPTSRRSF